MNIAQSVKEKYVSALKSLFEILCKNVTLLKN